MSAKTEYKISDGVTMVNGATVAGKKTVKLTDAEAAYDLALGRISPMGAVGKPAPRSEKPQETSK